MIACLNPVASTLTLYVTGSSALVEKTPDSDVVKVMDFCVPRFVIVTVAPGTTAPFGSTTVPLMPP
jgi:hypothetical protein